MKNDNVKIVSGKFERTSVCVVKGSDGTVSIKTVDPIQSGYTIFFTQEQAKELAEILADFTK